MAGQGKQIGALVLVLMGVLAACVTCGLPMWRETSFVGANIVTAQSVSRYIYLIYIFSITEKFILIQIKFDYLPCFIYVTILCRLHVRVSKAQTAL